MKILLAVDGSEYSEGAARFLSKFKLDSSDEVMILHVINFVPFLNEMEFYADTIFRMKQEIAPKILDASVEILKDTKATLSTAVVEGDIDKSIIGAAVDSGADLIVTGAKGLKGIKSIIIGSTTRSIAHNSPVPVLVIKKTQWETSEKIKILFATDGSEFADAAGKFIAGVPFGDGSEVMVLNVIRSAVHDIPERFIVEIDGRMKEEVARARTIEFAESDKIIQKTQEYLKEGFRRVGGLSKVGDPSIEILDAAEKHNADLVVVGCRGAKGAKGKLGTISRDIVRHATCSFLIGRFC
jgi:nucleotide-binding universal stress UspA family protein